MSISVCNVAWQKGHELNLPHSKKGKGIRYCVHVNMVTVMLGLSIYL